MIVVDERIETDEVNEFDTLLERLSKQVQITFSILKALIVFIFLLIYIYITN